MLRICRFLPLGNNLGEQLAVFFDELSALCRLELEVDRAEHEYLYRFSGSHSQSFLGVVYALSQYIGTNAGNLKQNLTVL